MKKFLLVCLLGMGALLPATTTTAKESISKRIINVTMEDWVLVGTSQTEDGPIVNMSVLTVPGGTRVASQSCSGYTCSLNISGLPSGAYVVWVTTTNSNFSKQFKKY